MQAHILSRFLLSGAVLIAAASAHSAPVYKYVGEDGSVTYSEVPPPGDGEVETMSVKTGLPQGQVESAQERTQRLQEFSAELEEARKGREEARAEQRETQPAQPPQTTNYSDRDTDRYPYYPGYAGPRPPLARPRPPGVVEPRPPIARPPIARPPIAGPSP